MARVYKVLTINPMNTEEIITESAKNKQILFKKLSKRNYKIKRILEGT
jgi:hypothetical protein